MAPRGDTGEAMTKVISLDLDKATAEAVSEALAHVWREIYDRERRGQGGKLRAVLDKLNTVTDARR